MNTDLNDKLSPLSLVTLLVNLKRHSINTHRDVKPHFGPVLENNLMSNIFDTQNDQLP